MSLATSESIDDHGLTTQKMISSQPVATLGDHEHLFRCPVSGARLRAATASEISRLNAEIASGIRRQMDGTPVSSPVQAALCTDDLGHAYRFQDGMFWLLPSLAMVSQPAATERTPEMEKASVRHFYDTYGWDKRADGLYRDTADFLDTRAIARKYQAICNRRIGRHLKGGRYLLDAASGAVPFPEYAAFSDRYRFHICLDFSTRALQEAQVALGDRGIYVLGDVTCLPFRDESIDDVISLHTIYHVPDAEQAGAIDELVRVAAPSGRVVVVYTWPYSRAMEIISGIRRKLGSLRRLGRRREPTAAPSVPTAESPTLYFRPKDYDWYQRHVERRHATLLRVWAFADTHRTLPNGIGGRVCLTAIRVVERLLPRWAARWGKYPMFVISKREGRRALQSGKERPPS